MSLQLLVQGVPAPSYDTPVAINREAFYGEELERLDEKMKGIKFPVIQVKMKEGDAYFARLRDHEGRIAARLLYTKDQMLISSSRGSHLVSSFCFDTKNYFDRLCAGAPCGVIDEVYKGPLTYGSPPLADRQYYVVQEGPRLVDEPYAYKGLSTYLVDCCKSLFGLSKVKKVSAVSLDKPKPQEV